MLTPKENYLRVMRHEIPEWMPSYFEAYAAMAGSDRLTPISAPNGVVYSPWGVPFVGSPENNNGAIPMPGHFILKDITKWRDVIKNPDLSDVDWEAYFTNKLKDVDRKEKVVQCGGSDYFQCLISFMGFTEGLIAMAEEPEEVYALMDYVSEYYLEVMKQEMKWCKPDIYIIADDCAATHAPFMSPDMYRRLVKPFHKRHADLALENGCYIDKHDCGRCEDFIDDWLDIGIRGWNPAQTCNDLKAIKKKYTGRLVLSGCWDNTGYISRPTTPDSELRDAVVEYVDTFAPGGDFVYLAMVMGKPEDETVKRKSQLIKDIYYDYARDWYKTH